MLASVGNRQHDGAGSRLRDFWPSVAWWVLLTEVRSNSGEIVRPAGFYRQTGDVPMPDEVVELLRAARKRQTEERLAFGPGYGPGEYVASDETGQPYHPDLLTSRWRRMLGELGIKRVRLHDARHSCATATHLRQVPTLLRLPRADGSAGVTPSMRTASDQAFCVGLLCGAFMWGCFMWGCFMWGCFMCPCSESVDG
jgi:hypothetical protein